MNIIFSRKGFDSSYGKMASPILPDGSMMSFPIPSNGSGARLFDSIQLNGRADHVKIVHDLSNGKISGSTMVHMDPDLYEGNLARKPGWKAAFGQVGSAQGHLSNKGIDCGDLFLFFGWFRRVEQRNGTWVFQACAPDVHVLFGWLQVGEIIAAGSDPETMISQKYPWMKDHPHSNTGYSKNNTIYAASDTLKLDGQIVQGVRGAGVFPHYSEDLQLTAASKLGQQYNRSHWSLPASFFKEGKSILSYHSNIVPEIESGKAAFDIVARGQEFVYPCSDKDLDVIDWAKNIIVKHGSNLQ